MFENEKIVESKICKHCESSFDITDKDLEFYEKISPSFGGKKYNIPTPKLCPDCRQQRRASFRNEKTFYKRKCSKTGEEIISIYNPSTKYTVFSQKEWHSDNRNPMLYGFDFDFNLTFFEQYKKLLDCVPKMTLITNYSKDVNSNYSNYAGSNKDCYMIFNSDFNENCKYINTGFYNKGCADCLNIYNCENCYDSVDLQKSYGCFSSENLVNCTNCHNCRNCISCNDCISCTNIKNKKYCFMNKQLSKEEYQKEFYKNIELENIEQQVNKFMIGENNISAEGNYIFNSKNISYSFDMYNSENCKYCDGIRDAYNCYDVFQFGLNSLDNCYESTAIGVGSNNVKFSSNVVIDNYDIFYSQFIYYNCAHCFGCVGLKNKSYCILNKQYSKEEYEKLVPKIIEHMQSSGEWGEFFPSSLSPFGYNETVAQEYFPIEIKTGLSKKDIKYIDIEGNAFKDLKESGERPVFKYSAYESPIPKVDKIIPANKLPEDIKDIPDDILNRAIECEITKKPFRIIKEELEFYRKHNLPIPRRHPDQRHLDRMKLRNPRKLYDRVCDKCKKEIKTTYSLERPEIVYCEECYNKEIY